MVRKIIQKQKPILHSIFTIGNSLDSNFVITFLAFSALLSTISFSAILMDGFKKGIKSGMKVALYKTRKMAAANSKLPNKLYKMFPTLMLFKLKIARMQIIKNEVINLKTKQIQAARFPFTSPPIEASKVVATVPKVAPIIK